MSDDSADARPAIKRIDSISLSSQALGAIVKAFTEKGNQIKFTARGDSMFPFIKDGETVLVSPYGQTQPDRGDIIAYIDSSTKDLIVHRIIALTSDMFSAKGDCCLQKDPIQPQSNILGYISKTSPPKSAFYENKFTKNGQLISFLSKIGFIQFFGIILKYLDKTYKNLIGFHER